jgi:hypothetical protein
MLLVIPKRVRKSGENAMLKVFSFGGGVQSTAALVLAAQGRIDYRTFLFCNVGADSENPETLAYVRDVARPFADRHGLMLHELERVKRDGSVETIYQRMTRPGSRSIGIPVCLVVCLVVDLVPPILRLRCVIGGSKNMV